MTYPKVMNTTTIKVKPKMIKLLRVLPSMTFIYLMPSVKACSETQRKTERPESDDWFAPVSFMLNLSLTGDLAKMKLDPFLV